MAANTPTSWATPRETGRPHNSHLWRPWLYRTERGVASARTAIATSRPTSTRKMIFVGRARPASIGHHPRRLSLYPACSCQAPLSMSRPFLPPPHDCEGRHEAGNLANMLRALPPRQQRGCCTFVGYPQSGPLLQLDATLAFAEPVHGDHLVLGHPRAEPGGEKRNEGRCPDDPRQTSPSPVGPHVTIPSLLPSVILEYAAHRSPTCRLPRRLCRGCEAAGRTRAHAVERSDHAHLGLSLPSAG